MDTVVEIQNISQSSCKMAFASYNKDKSLLLLYSTEFRANHALIYFSGVQHVDKNIGEFCTA